MTRLAFVDESQRSGLFVLAAVAVEHGRVEQARRQLQAMAPRAGSARRHFVKESDNDKKRLLGVFRELRGAASCVCVVVGEGRPTEQRAEALERLVAHLLLGGLDRMIFDHVEEHQQRRDRQILARVLRGADVSYSFEPAHSTEPFLWVPDGVAWCAGRNDWRPRLTGWVETVP